MAPNVIMTPVMNKVDCNVPKCNKTLKNLKNLNSHMEKVHKVFLSITQSPLANTVRTLFSGDNEALPSTQGNSSGAVNSPKVRTEGAFQCGACEKEYSTSMDLKEHMKVHVNVNDKAEAAIQRDDFMPDDQDLVDIAEDIEMQEAAKEVEANGAEVIKMVTVDKIVDSFVDNAYRAMNPQQDAEKEICHDCGLKEEVINERGRAIDDREAKLIEKAATVSGLGLRVKKLSVDNTLLRKKLKQTDKLRKHTN